MGLNNRESRLVDRVKDVENQNRVLRRQLSISQTQLMKSAMTSKQNKLKKQNHRRRLSSNPNEIITNNEINNNNYYGQNGEETGPDQDDSDVNDIGNEEVNENNMKLSKCAVSCLIFKVF